MESDKASSQESDYQELLLKLERANENLAYYKSNKEICMRDLHKLELENSALMEENNYLKKKITNVEKNMSSMIDKTEDIERPLDTEEIPNYAKFGSREKVAKVKIPPINSWKTYDNITTTSGTNRPASRIQTRVGSISPFCKREMSLLEMALLKTILIYRV